MGNSYGKGSLGVAIGALANSTEFTREEVEKLHAYFVKRAEETPDDPYHLTKEQFAEICQANGITGERVDVLFQLFDKSQDGFLSFKEFVTGMAELERKDSYKLSELH